jgi:hypothetical protein
VVIRQFLGELFGGFIIDTKHIDPGRDSFHFGARSPGDDSHSLM